VNEHVAPTVGSQDPGGRRLHLVVAAEIDGRIAGAVDDGDGVAAGAQCRRDRAPDRACASGDDRDRSHG
jgi:hypothetical protein